MNCPLNFHQGLLSPSGFHQIGAAGLAAGTRLRQNPRSQNAENSL
jgi:hypothetical protein